MRSWDRAVRLKAHQIPISSLRIERAIPSALMFSGYAQALSYIHKWAEEQGHNVEGFMEASEQFEIGLLCRTDDAWGVFDQAEPMQVIPENFESLFFDYCAGMHFAASDFKSWSAKVRIDGTPIIHAIHDLVKRETTRFLQKSE